MQEEVENRTFNLMVSTTKLTERSIMNALRAYIHHRTNVKMRNAMAKGRDGRGIKGKQSVRELLKSGESISSIELADGKLRTFKRLAEKYNIDYAVKKDRSTDPPRYMVFFKGRDIDSLNHVVNEYAKKTIKQQNRESLLKKLANLREKHKNTPHKSRKKQRERTR